MKKSFKRVLSVVLVALMLALMIPTGMFSATAADAVTQKTVYIGSEATFDSEGLSGDRYDTLTKAFDAYKWGNDNDTVYYTIIILEDIEETVSLADNWRADATIKAYDPANKPTVTINIAGGTKKSAWCLLGGSQALTVENVDFTVADTHGGNNSVFGVGADCSLTLDTVSIVTPANVNNTETAYDAWTIQIRSEVAEFVKFKGACSFTKGGANDGKWLGGFAARTSGKNTDHTIIFDGATINTGSVTMINNTATTTVNVNVINGSKLTVGNGHMFCNTGNGKIVVNASSPEGATGDARTSFKSTGSGKMFYSTTQLSNGTASKAGTVEVNLNNVYASTTGAQMFHIQGTASSTVYSTVKGTVVNSELDASASSQYMFRSWGDANTNTLYAHFDLAFVGTTIIQGTAGHIAAFGRDYDNVKLSFDGCKIINNKKAGARLVHSSGANSNITLEWSANNTYTGNKPDYFVYASADTSTVKLVLDGYRLHANAEDATDNTYQELKALSTSGKLYYTAKEFEIVLRNCTTKNGETDEVMNLGAKVGVASDSSAIPNDFFANIYALGNTPAKTYTVTLDNTYINMKNAAVSGVTNNQRGVFGVSGTKGSNWNNMTTYNTNFINGTTIITTETKLYDYRQGGNGTRTFNVLIEDSTITATNATLLTNGQANSTTYAFGTFNIDIKGDKSNVNVKQLVYSLPASNTAKTKVNVNIYDGTVNASGNMFQIVDSGSGDVHNFTIHDGNITSSASIFRLDTAASGSDNNFTVYGGTLKAATHEAYVATATAGSDNDINIYGGTFKTTNSHINVTESLASDATGAEGTTTVVNIYGGTFGNLTTTCTATGISIRGIGTTANIYGGEFYRKSTTETMLVESRTNLNVYGGLFVFDTTHQNAQLIRHGYKMLINSDLTLSPEVAGLNNTSLDIYGGTFITGTGCVVGAGTSTGNGFLGNVYVYGGVFVKTVQATTSGYGIIGHKNNRTSATDASNRESLNNYHILGGVWVTTATGDVFGYKIAKNTSGSYSYQKGQFNVEAANITTKNADVTANTYANMGITDAAWAKISSDGVFNSNSYVAEVVVAKDGYQQFLADKAVRFGAHYVQVKSGTTAADATTNIRILFEIEKTVANNGEFEEIGYFISKTNSDAAAIIAEGNKAVDETNTIYSSVYQGAGEENWTPNGAGKGIVVLNVNNLSNEYFAQGAVFYVVAYVKTTSGHTYYSTAYTIDVTTKNAADIAK